MSKNCVKQKPIGEHFQNAAKLAVYITFLKYLCCCFFFFLKEDTSICFYDHPIISSALLAICWTAKPMRHKNCNEQSLDSVFIQVQPRLLVTKWWLCTSRDNVTPSQQVLNSSYSKKKKRVRSKHQSTLLHPPRRSHVENVTSMSRTG